MSSEWCLQTPRASQAPVGLAVSLSGGRRPFAGSSRRRPALLPSPLQAQGNHLHSRAGLWAGRACCVQCGAARGSCAAASPQTPRPCSQDLPALGSAQNPSPSRAPPEPGGRAPWDRDLEILPSQRPMNSSLEPSATELMQNESRFVMALAPESLGKILSSARQSKLQASLQGPDSRTRKHTSSDMVPLTISRVVFHGTQSDNYHMRHAGGQPAILGLRCRGKGQRA